MKKILIILSLVFILSACSDYDDDFKKNKVDDKPIIDSTDIIKSNINNEVKPVFLNV
jgi:protein involved in sex pheromone biosynthesis